MTTSTNALDLTNPRIKNSPYAGWFGTVRHYYGHERLGSGIEFDKKLSTFGISREAGADFLLPGGAHHYFALLNNDADMETKILLSGITEQYQIGFGVGCCAYPSLEAAGLAILIGAEISMTTGTAEIPVEYFTNYLGLTDKKLKRLNKHLTASGVLDITEDEDAAMITCKLTTFGLAQIAASRDLVNTYQADDQPIGPYINVVMQVPDIAARLGELMSFLSSLAVNASAA